MRVWIASVLAVALPLFTWAATVALANRFYLPPEVEEARFVEGMDLPVAGSQLTLATWNIGYGGMGAEADFVVDMGQQSRPTERSLVERNAAAIAALAASLGTEIVLVQEAARPSWNTHGVDVLAAVSTGLVEYGHAFGADIDTRFMPAGFNIEIGNATFSRLRAVSAEMRRLPLEPKFTFGVFRKTHRMHVLRLDGPERWVLINVHLSAFDDTVDAVRERQLEAVIAFAEAEYRAGNHVIVGGDFNMRLAATTFPNTTEERYLFWLRDLDPAMIPAGWTLGVDPAIPTSRANYQPYVEGENFRLIIDGFLVSPNVEIVSVKGTDLHFAHSDHNPVTMTARAR